VNIRIGGFGHATQQADREGAIPPGSTVFPPPIDDLSLNYCDDVWAFGCTLLEVVAGSRAFLARRDDCYGQALRQSLLPKLLTIVSEGKFLQRLIPDDVQLGPGGEVPPYGRKPVSSHNSGPPSHVTPARST
jgi:hypothetical protein